jgi:hypothetical protein
MWTVRAVLLLAYTKKTLPLVVVHKRAGHWNERLTRSSVTKLIGLHIKLLA